MSEELSESISGDVTVWLTNKRAKKSAVIRWDEKWWLTMNDGVREFADLLDAVKAALEAEAEVLVTVECVSMLVEPVEQ